MEMREKLFEIIDNNLCMENNWVTKESIYKAADAVIESGLIKDEKVYKPKLNCIDYGIRRYECSNCGREVTSCNYCPKCGVRVKEDSKEDCGVI